VHQLKPLSKTPLTPNFQVSSAVHSLITRPYNADTITKCIQHDPPPPIVCNRVKEYEVEWILDSQVFRGKLEYLVFWKGYRIKEDEWRPGEDVEGSRWLVSEFHHRNPEAPQHMCTHVGMSHL